MLRKILPRSNSKNDPQLPAPRRTSSSPRRSLQRAVLERRESLTERECNFLLNNVCEQGSEHQARLAHMHVLDLLPVDAATGRSASSASSEFDKQGSTRRQSLLEQRKRSSCKLWEAHDSGLALTAAASQRSIRRLQANNSPKKAAATMVARVRSLTKPRSMPRPLKMGPRSRTVYSDSSDDESSRGLSIVEQRQRRLSSSMWSGGSKSMLHQQLTKEDFLTESENESGPLATEVSSSSLLTHDDVPPPPKPNHAIMTREASMNTYMGEGFEIGLVQNGSGEARDGGETRREDVAVRADDAEREGLLVDSDDDDDDDDDALLLRSMQSPKKLQRPVLFKMASMSVQAPGEGMEVADWNHEWRVHHHQNIGGQQVIPFRKSNSFDQSMSYDRVNDRFTNTLKRSLSDGALSDHEEADQYFLSKIEEYDHYDPWDLLDDIRSALPFKILGTHAHDVECHPHVLSPPLMERLQQYLPFTKRGENMLLKYSLVRDGASIHSFLKHARGASHAFLAVETVDGEVFGSFTAETWHKSQETYGNGQSFLWRMQHSRHEKAWSVIDQAQHESEIDVFPFISGSSRVQLCNDKYMVVGGLGDTSASSPTSPLSTTLLDGTVVGKNEWGFGLCFTGDVLLEGTSAPCVSFQSPSLSAVHSDGSTFEIVNLELWTVTPCMTAERAAQLELKHLFLEDNLRRI